MTASLAPAIGALRPVSLDELDGRAALLHRVDSKYLVPAEAFARLLVALAPDHDALEIDGRRSFRYESIYLDTPELRCFRDHVEDRSPRFKVRSRLYVDSALCRFELKVKGSDGETTKEQLDLDPADHGTVTRAARAFLDEHLRRAAVERAPDLAPTLVTRFERCTVAARSGGERLTADAGLELARPDGGAVALDPGLVVVESKSEDGASRANEHLAELGCEPVGLSKYRAGIALLVAADPSPPLGAELGRRFRPRPGRSAAGG